MTINKYLSEFEFVGSSIKTIKIRNDFITMNNIVKSKKTIDVTHSIDSIQTNKEEEKILGIITLNIKVLISEGKKKLNINMSIEGCFRGPAEMGEEQFKNMLQVNGVTSLYSISRGFIQSTTSQMLSSGSVVLPMFNVAAYSEDVSEITDMKE